MGNMGDLMQRMAVIDMGSNSFRLVVFEYEPTGWWSLVDEIREPTPERVLERMAALDHLVAGA